MRFTIFQDSRIGGRRVNQDRLAYSYSKEVLLMVIADGMGGHARGEIAAEITVNTITKRFQQDARGPLRRPLEFLENAFFSAHRAIVAFADQHEMLECPRTTCVACIVQNNKAYWAHSGDSRLYTFRNGRLAAATVDHSRVQQLIDAGRLTREEAASHPERNKIYNCLGGVLPPQVALAEEWFLQVGDTIMLSTDGFWGPLTSQLIATRLQSENLVTLAPKLLEEAEHKAGSQSDNLSVVAMTWERQDEEEPSSITITSTVPMEGFSTTTNSTPHKDVMTDEISDDDITRAIREIQHAIKKVLK